MKRVVLTGMYAPYLGPFDGAEVWGCNRTYKTQEKLTRLYFMDSLWRFMEEPGDFVADVNALGIPVVAQEAYPEIELCEAFPLKKTVRFFFGDDSDETIRQRAYFTSTIAYMLADAIRLGFEEITIHRILSLPASCEYMSQKPCLDFWCGVAMGRGVKLRISSDSNLCQPCPWEPGLYGYEIADNPHAHHSIISGLKAAAHFKTSFRSDSKH